MLKPARDHKGLLVAVQCSKMRDLQKRSWSLMPFDKHFAGLFIFHPVSLRFLWPKASDSFTPLGYLLRGSGHIRALRDTKGHKKPASFLSVL